MHIMWNLMSPMGHSGLNMGPRVQQKNNFGFNFPNVTIAPGKSFRNPNFVNKSNPIVHHSYQYNFNSTPLQKICETDSPVLNKVDRSLVNSSQSIIDTIRKNRLDVVKDPETNLEVENILENTSDMCHTRKRTKDNRNFFKKLNKHSKEKNFGRQIKDMMEIDIEMENSTSASDTSMSPKSPKTLNLTDFIVESSNKPINKVKDAEFLTTVISISPPNNCKSVFRERQLSIAESEDSYIVFDSAMDEDLDSYEESDFSESDIEEDFDSSASVIPYKRVRFADNDHLCEVHPMIQWSFAYHTARKGPWEEYARDRVRFRKRITETENMLAPILDARHREHVYKERFQESV